MMIFILAAGNAERWGGECKHLKEVRGETVLRRTVKMLNGRDYRIITHHPKIQHISNGYRCEEPSNHNTLLNTVLSTETSSDKLLDWDQHDEIMFLMGDVVWTKAALDKVLEPIDKHCQFYGSWDEHFAFRFKAEFYEQVKAHINLILSQGMEGTTWQLYRSICGMPLREHWLETWFRTLIDDKTDDIDYPDDYNDKIETGYFDDPEFDG